MIKGVDHIGIRVAEMDRSIKFYQDLFGLTLLDRRKISEVTELAFLSTGGQTELELICKEGDPVPQNDGMVNHFALAVSDIEAAAEQLRRQGVAFTPEKPNFIEALNAWNLFFRGPDGERIELFCRKQG